MNPIDPDAPTDAPAARSARHFFRGQLIHLGSIPVLAAVSYSFAAPALGDGAWLGLSDTAWFVLCLLLPIVHQIFVWTGWRAQLGWRLFTRMFGKADFIVWGAIFLTLLATRPLVVVGLAAADAGSSALPGAVGAALGGLLLLPAVYAMASVARWFGIDRALGGDHFRERYRHLPFVKKGAFRLTPNAMYVFVFLALWSIALIAGSVAAQAAAFFQHAFIFAHYLGTEEPDMRLLYGGSNEG